LASTGYFDMAKDTEGNPFFIGELLRGLEEQGELAATDSGWRVADLEDTALPMLVREVIAARVARLGETARSRTDRRGSDR
jgi:predicted ATPase